ncbi:MAG: aminotransferase class I/II-fold pyridoxal phosphate-dependent enzyme [Gemmataceae bacterium]|nr:aminotransferase class I/II-fold pyridoxal phosphate-dependent enzyme [Gemmataceae bacterium]
MAVDSWISQRAHDIEMSGVRKIFELSRGLKDPIDLSIGQPHFPAPDAVKAAAIRAIETDKAGYSVTQGIPELRGKLKKWTDEKFRHDDREVLVTSGTSGALILAMLATINPGDEVILFEPYFVAYPAMVTLAGGTPVVVETYPKFEIDIDRVRAAITPRTKAILFNSPANPTGVVPQAGPVAELAKLCHERGILLISDEIYRAFTYDGPAVCPATWNPETLVIDGFGKTYGITGWRLGFAHGPRTLIEQMAKMQQFTFVCAPSMVQHAGVAAMDVDVAPLVAEYRRNRDRLVAALSGKYELVKPGGAFYLFPKVPWGTASEFVAKAIEHNLLVIPGSVFGRRDTHFRISFATKPETLERGIEVLLRIADRP